MKSAVRKKRSILAKAIGVKVSDLKKFGLSKRHLALLKKDIAKLKSK